jgi:hypothetical protein
MWTNDGHTPLYCVKRKLAEEYHSGSASSVMPRLYKLRDARRVCNEMNGDSSYSFNSIEDVREYTKESKKYYSNPDDWEKSCVSTFEYLQQDKAKGPWIVAEVQMCASEYVELTK